MVRNYAGTKSGGIGKKVYTEIMFGERKMLMGSQIFSLSGIIVFPKEAEGDPVWGRIILVTLCFRGPWNIRQRDY